MSIITAFTGTKRPVLYPFCFLPFLGLFFMKLTITFSAMLSVDLVRRHLVNRARNDVLHKNKEKLFSICPTPYPRKSPTGPFQSTPHTRAQMAGLVPVVVRGIVTGLTNCTVHQ